MKNTVIVIFSLLTCLAEAQNKYGLKATTLNEYKASVKVNTSKELINLKDFIPNLVLDIRYATTNNFTGEKIYNLARAYARKPVAEIINTPHRTSNVFNMDLPFNLGRGKALEFGR